MLDQVISYVIDRFVPALGIAACLGALWLVVAKKNRSLRKPADKHGFEVKLNTSDETPVKLE